MTSISLDYISMMKAAKKDVYHAIESWKNVLTSFLGKRLVYAYAASLKLRFWWWPSLGCPRTVMILYDIGDQD